MIGRIQYRVRKARCLVAQCKQELILVWKYSRFARNREDLIAFKAMLRKAEVPVISITEPFEDTPTGRLLEAMIESLDEFYSVNLGEEVTRGMTGTVHCGGPLWARTTDLSLMSSAVFHF